jgi:lysozyme family protein
MESNFQRALAAVLEKEGGKANLAHDPGGRTNQGITQDTYNYYRESAGLAPRSVFQLEDHRRRV